MLLCNTTLDSFFPIFKLCCPNMLPRTIKLVSMTVFTVFSCGINGSTCTHLYYTVTACLKIKLYFVGSGGKY